MIKSKREIWKDVPNYGGKYEISNMGRVASYLNGNAKYLGKDKQLRHINKQSLICRKKGTGYLQVTLQKGSTYNNKHCLVHRLIAEAFIPNPEKKAQINHKNGIKHDNRIENLEWVTASENSKHSWRIGLSKSTKAHKSSAKRAAEIYKNTCQDIRNGKDVDKSLTKLCTKCHQIRIPKGEENKFCTDCGKIARLECARKRWHSRTEEEKQKNREYRKVYIRNYRRKSYLLKDYNLTK